MLFSSLIGILLKNNGELFGVVGVVIAVTANDIWGSVRGSWGVVGGSWIV